ncbi:uncharacterized protein LOC143149099 [Ptiloglossa arizonensis]|uniref:uncharacterized protein LOC143149099 n=1 Tax=Ptiloglossa arizonensis TaxID=3350558 RepID=UPI003FA05972
MLAPRRHLLPYMVQVPSETTMAGQHLYRAVDERTKVCAQWEWLVRLDDPLAPCELGQPLLSLQQHGPLDLEFEGFGGPRAPLGPPPARGRIPVRRRSPSRRTWSYCSDGGFL